MSTEKTPEPAVRKTPEPVLITMSILAGLHILFGGAAAISFVADDPLIGGLLALGNVAVGAATYGVQFYVRGKVTPLPDEVTLAAPQHADKVEQ